MNPGRRISVYAAHGATRLGVTLFDCFSTSVSRASPRIDDAPGGRSSSTMTVSAPTTMLPAFQVSPGSPPLGTGGLRSLSVSDVASAR